MIFLVVWKSKEREKNSTKPYTLVRRELRTGRMTKAVQMNNFEQST